MRSKPSGRRAIERRGARRQIRRPLARLALAAMLGLCATVLAACSSTNPGLIPATNASPLQVDFETVAQDAQNGNGSCGETAAAIRKTEQDFSELPQTVASNLRNTLSGGIANLSNRALTLCAKVTQSTTTTTDTTTSATATTTFTSVETTTTETTASSVPTTSSPGGGTPAPGAGEATPPAAEAPAGAGGAGVQEGLK
jgi:hypothetical protein